MLLGAGLLLYSLARDYELGVLRVIPVRVHLGLDALGETVLLAAALLAHQAPIGWILCVLGIAEIAASLLTRTAAEDGAGIERAPVLSTFRDVGMPRASSPRDADERPQSPVPPRQVQNVEQLRRAIDSGAMGDKVAMTDPAMVPLGADDEGRPAP